MKKALKFFKRNISREVAFIIITFFFSALTFFYTHYNLYSSKKEYIIYKEKIVELNKFLKRSESLKTSLEKDLKYEVIITSLLENINSGISTNSKIFRKYEYNLLNDDSVSFYVDSLNSRNFNLIFDIGKITAFKYSDDKNYSEGQSIYSTLLKSELQANKNILAFLNKKIPRNDSIQQSINNYNLNLQTLVTYAESKADVKEKIDEMDSNEYLKEINKIENEYRFKRIIFMFLSIVCIIILTLLIIFSIKSGYMKK